MMKTTAVSVLILLLCCIASQCRADTVTLSYMMWGSVNEIKSVRKSLDEFESTHPGLKVRIVHASGSSNYRTKLQTMAAGGVPPDLMYVEATDFPAYHIRGMFLDLTPYAEADEHFSFGDYYPRLMELFTVCYAVSKETKHPEAAWKLASFMAGRRGQMETAASGHAVPSITSIAESDTFLKAKELPAGLDHAASIRALAYAQPLPVHPSWMIAQDILQRNIDLIFISEDADIPSVLKQTQKQLEEMED